MDKATMTNLLAKTHADLSKNVHDYKTKLERLECCEVIQATASLEYHYACIRDNLHQIEYHLQEIENQCKQLDLAPITSTPKLTGNKHEPLVYERLNSTRGVSSLLTPKFLQTFDAFHEVSNSLNRKPPTSNQTQSTSWDETML